MKRIAVAIPELMHDNKDNISIIVEILPPIRGKGISSLFNIIDTI